MCDRFTIASVLHRGRDAGAVTYIAAAEDQSAWLCQAVGPVPRGPESRTAEAAFDAALAALRSYDHPSLARIHETFTAQGGWYLVIEHPGGESLESYVAARAGLLSMQEVLDIARQLCDVLAYLTRQHPTFILDEVDPAFVYVGRDGTVKLVDYRLFRCLTGRSVLSDQEELRAANYRVFADLVSFLMTGRRGAADVPRLKGYNERLAAVVERCQSYLQTPGYSFQEVRRSLERALAASMAPARLSPGSLLRRVHPAVWIGLLLVVGAAVELGGYFGGSATPAGPAAWVVCDGHDVMRVDPERLRLTGKLPLRGARVVDAAVMQDGRDLVMADAEANELRILDTTTDREVAPLSLPGQPSALLTLPGSPIAYVLLPASNTAVKLAGWPLRVKHSAALKPGVAGAAWSRDGRWLFYTAAGGEVYALDTATDRTLPGVFPCKGSGPLAVSPDDAELWVADHDGRVSVVSLAGLAVRGPGACALLGTVSGLNGGADAIQFSPDGMSVLVLNQDAGTVSVVERGDRQVKTSFATNGTHPFAWGYTSLAPPVMWILNQDSASITVVDMQSFRARRILRLGGTPTAFGVSPASHPNAVARAGGS